jgi:hypothetical protein
MNKIVRILILFILTGINVTSYAQDTAEEQELIDLALQVSNELYKGNFSFYNELFYLDSFLNRVVFADEKELRTFNKEFNQGFKSNFSWGKDLNAFVNAGGLYEPVSFTTLKDSYYITFSMFGNTGLNYHEVEFKRIKGKLRIIDVFVYLNGEQLSESVKMAYIGAVDRMDLLSTLNGSSQSYMKDMSSILDFKTLVDAGEFKKLNVFLEQTTDAFKQTIFYYNFKVAALNGVGDMEAYYDFLKNNRSIGVPSSYLTNIDLMFLEKDWPAFQDNLNQLDEFVGGDPILNNFRGNGFLNAGDFVNARKSFQQVYDDFPDYSYGIIGLLSTGLELGDADLCVNS